MTWIDWFTLGVAVGGFLLLVLEEIYLWLRR
jgi:hypothetical protein